MGHKLVCFNCREAKSLGLDNEKWEKQNKICTKCNEEFRILDHRFRPPKKEDVKKWKVVEFLYDNGFRYEHISDNELRSYAKVPETMKEAKLFVEKYLISNNF